VRVRDISRYVPNFAETLKFAWIQFLATFVAAYYLLGHLLQRFLFERHIVETDVVDDTAAGLLHRVKMKLL